MNKNEASPPSESNATPPYLRPLSPQMLALVEKHFWCDFSDIIPALSWDNNKTEN